MKAVTSEAVVKPLLYVRTDIFCLIKQNRIKRDKTRVITCRRAVKVIISTKPFVSFYIQEVLE